MCTPMKCSMKYAYVSDMNIVSRSLQQHAGDIKTLRHLTAHGKQAFREVRVSRPHVRLRVKGCQFAQNVSIEAGLHVMTKRSARTKTILDI